MASPNPVHYGQFFIFFFQNKFSEKSKYHDVPFMHMDEIHIKINLDARTVDDCFGITLDRAMELTKISGACIDSQLDPVDCIKTIRENCQNDQEFAYCLIHHGIKIGWIMRNAGYGMRNL